MVSLVKILCVPSLSILILAGCSQSSYFSKEGQSLGTIDRTCPWGKGHATSEEHFNDLTINGVGNISNTTVKGQATINGAATIKQAVFKKDLVVRGAATIKQSSIAESVSIFGQVNLDEVHIAGKTTIFGIISASSSILQDLEINCSEAAMQLEKCSLDNITIKINPQHPHDAVTLELIDTTIKGNIFFSNEHGKIILKGTAHIKGRVTGGQIIK